MNANHKHQGALFDLDGVLVDTAHYHFLAWKKIASKLDYDLKRKDNEQLKGVSRIDSLKKILSLAGKTIEAPLFKQLLEQKNEDYLNAVKQITPADLLPGVKEALEFLKERNIKMGLGSASKNALIIFERLQITHYFEALIDGNSVEHSKPHPEVFLKGAQALGLTPADCVVFEDSQAGIIAAKAGGMTAVALGEPSLFTDTDYCYPNFNVLNIELLPILF